MSSRTPPLRLELSGEPKRGIELPKSGMLVIGSSPERAGFVVEGQGIDPAHCAVGRTKRGGWAIKDLGSKYGTLVNGETVTSTRLRQGDVITLGSRRIQVQNPSDAPTQIAEPATPAAAEAPAADEGAVEQAPPEPTRRSALAEAVKERAALPARIGGYRIERPLGRGGMGAVYLAMQESLNRPVALKVLARRLSDNADFVGRFQSEARAAAALNHPNVVVVYDVGESAGHHYLSMEFMPGGSLEQRLAAAGPLPWRQVLDALHDAAGGLRYAESKGIVHRDIKPANLMLTGTGTVKIADLGLATTVDAEAENVDGRKILGTPHFISPEQARGEPVDHRSDLYSLGATAYRLLTGRTPFEGETTRDILRAHFQERPTPPSTLVPGLPAELENVVAKLMEKRPEDRFASADELRLLLDRLRLRADHGETFEAAGARKTPRGLWVGLGVLAVGAAAAVVLGGGEPEDTGGLRGAAPPEVVQAQPPEPDPGFFEDPEPAPAEGEGADEKLLEMRELRAERDYLRLAPDLLPEDRIAALEALVADYEGTSIATRALQEIDDLQGSLTRERLATAQLEVQLDNALGVLRTALAWPPSADELPDPGQTLRRLRAHPDPPELVDSPEWLGKRAALLGDVLRLSAQRIEEALERADQRAETGAFDEVRELLQALLARLDLPEATEADRDGMAVLSALGSEVRKRLAELPALEASFQSERLQQERATVSARIGRASGLTAELEALDFKAMAARLAGLEEALAGSALPARALSLQSDLTAAKAALTGLVADFQEDQWRRRSIMDLRARRRSAREVSDVSLLGITLDVEGSGEFIPWEELEADADWFAQLFKGRVEREYTPLEQRGILALMRFTAAGRVVRLAMQMLDPSDDAKLQPNEIEDIRGALEAAGEWLDENPAMSQEERTRLEKERAGLALLADALLAAHEQRWGAAATRLERLLASHSDCLFVLLLSDGSAH